ncbi:hypothetical protein ALC57_13394 [Trachymyrmex cornetzi]|uniref:Uncharacterized protein n=1 Tax=Trachymyrmex cornetzi TaxID=471704 RepID=A0A195DN18_9HYME|nr:hypothetical protein ALC57_13394 [Trachymyrmex cornetzi]
MRMSAEVMIRLLHLSYRTNANVLPASPSFRAPSISKRAREQAPCSTTRQAAVTSSLSPRANQIQRGGTELKSLGRLCARD